MSKESLGAVDVIVKATIKNLSEKLAEECEMLARTIPSNISGSDALLLFASSIRDTNKTFFMDAGNEP